MERKELPKLDVSKYIGTKSKIANAEVRNSKYGTVVYVETEPIPLIDGDELPKDVTLRASNMMGLHQDEESDNFFIATDSKLDMFLKSFKVDISEIPENIKVGDKIDSLIGKNCTVQKKESGYLEIAY